MGADWPTHSQVAKRLKVSVTQVRRLRGEGALSAEQDEKGVWRFDPEAIEEYERKQPTNAVNEAIGQILGEKAAGLGGLFEVLLHFTESLFERYERHDTKRAEYISKLEDSNLAMRASAETALSQEQERLIMAQKAEHDMKMKEQVLKSLTELGLPLVAHQVEQHFAKAAAAKANGEKGAA